MARERSSNVAVSSIDIVDGKTDIRIPRGTEFDVILKTGDYGVADTVTLVSESTKVRVTPAIFETIFTVKEREIPVDPPKDEQKGEDKKAV